MPVHFWDIFILKKLPDHYDPAVSVSPYSDVIPQHFKDTVPDLSS